MSGTAMRARTAVFVGLAAAAAARRVEVVRETAAVQQLSLAALLPKAALGFIVAIALRFALMSQRRRRRQIAANGDEPALDLQWQSGTSQLSDELTINGQTIYPSLSYDAADATAAAWPGRVGTTLALAGIGDDPALSAGSPLLDGSSVKFAGGKYYAAADNGVDLGTDDWVAEVIYEQVSQGDERWIFSKYHPTNNVEFVATAGSASYMYANGDEAAAVIPGPESGSGLGFKHALICYKYGVEAVTHLQGHPGATTNIAGVGPLTIAGPWALGGASAAGKTSAVRLIGFRLWKATSGWLDSASQPTIATQRFHGLTGVSASKAKGSPYPTTASRTTPAYLDKIESDGTRKAYLVGPNWPRVVTRKDKHGTTIQGYLSEAQVTNQIDNTDIGGATWGATANVTRATSNTLDPFGNAMIDILEDSGTGTHLVYDGAVVISPGTKCTVSCFAKAQNTGRYLLIHSQHAPTAYATFDLVNGTIDAIAGSCEAAHIEDWGDGIYRCIMQRTAAVGTTGIYIAPKLASGSNVNTSFAGRGEVTVSISAPQVEYASYASSWIKTNGSVVTRTADLLKYASDDNISSARGSIELSTYIEDYDSEGGWALFDIGAGAADKLVAAAGAGAYAITLSSAKTGGDSGSAASVTDLVDGEIHTVRASWGGDAITLKVDDDAPVSDTTAPFPTTLTGIAIGTLTYTGAYQARGVVGPVTIRRA